MTRHIRLKEWGQNVDVFKEPSDEYINRCDNLSKEPYRLRTDADGFIVTGNAENSGARPLLILGGSVVENMYVHEGRRMCDHLERILCQGSITIRILNGGVSGSTILHQINLFLNKGIPLELAGVVVMASINDITVAREPSSYWSDDQYISPLVSHETGSHTQTAKCLSEPDFCAHLKMLEVLKTVANVHGIPIWIATIAHRMSYDDTYIKQKYPSRDEFERHVQYRCSLNEGVRKFCIKREINLIDLESKFSGFANLFYDEFHYNEYGSQIVAETIADTLVF